MGKLFKLKNSGFTVIEVLITLFVTAGLILIGSLCLKGYEDELILNNTVKETITALEQASRVSTIRRERVDVEYLPESSQIAIVGIHFRRTIFVNKKVKIQNLENLRISSKGILSPRTITFLSNKSRKKIKLQMTWGRIIYD